MSTLEEARASLERIRAFRMFANGPMEPGYITCLYRVYRDAGEYHMAWANFLRDLDEVIDLAQDIVWEAEGAADRNFDLDTEAKT